MLSPSEDYCKHLLSGPGASFCSVQQQLLMKSSNPYQETDAAGGFDSLTPLQYHVTFTRIKNVEKPDVYILEQSVGWGVNLDPRPVWFRASGVEGTSEALCSRDTNQSQPLSSKRAGPKRSWGCLWEEDCALPAGRTGHSCWQKSSKQGQTWKQTHTTGWACFCTYSAWSRAKRNMLRCSHRSDSGKSLN